MELFGESHFRVFVSVLVGQVVDPIRFDMIVSRIVSDFQIRLVADPSKI